MLQTAVSTILIVSALGLAPLKNSAFAPVSKKQKQVISERKISLENRQNDKFVNSVFKDNILLTLAYLDGRVTSKEDLIWDEVRKPFTFEFKLKRGETFAYHENVSKEYKERVLRTTNAHFNGEQGFLSDGYLMGDGVCHLASLMYWVAKDAGVESSAPTNHDFAVINEVPKEFGVSIYYSGARGNEADGNQNLYITNNLDKDLTFRFEFDGNILTFIALEEI